MWKLLLRNLTALGGGAWSPNLRVLSPVFYLPVFRDLSVSVCLLFALVEVYTDPAHIRGGGGLHLVWTLRGMGVRGNMVWGSGERAGGGAARDNSESGLLRAREQKRGGGSGFHWETKRLTESPGLDHFRHGPLLGLGAEAPVAWRVSHSMDGGHFFQPLEKQRIDRVVKQKAKETWKHLTALIHHGPSFFLCSHYICL